MTTTQNPRCNHPFPMGTKVRLVDGPHNAVGTVISLGEVFDRHSGNYTPTALIEFPGNMTRVVGNGFYGLEVAAS